MVPNTGSSVHDKHQQVAHLQWKLAGSLSSWSKQPLSYCLACIGSIDNVEAAAGNINQLILKVESYARSLQESQGIIAEFVNPKYKDASKTDFKSSTRLECMMQDYPKALPSTAAVGFTVINQVC